MRRDGGRGLLVAQRGKQLMTPSLSFLSPTIISSNTTTTTSLFSSTATTINKMETKDTKSASSLSTTTNTSDHFIIQQKKALRSKIRKDLKAMSPIQRSQEDAAIQDLVLNSSWFKSSKGLCAYISCESLREVDTSRILSEILSSDCHGQIKKKLYVPRVEDKNSHMRMLNISSIEDLIPNSMNILEPAPTDVNGNQREDVMHASEPVDLLLLPGLAFDRFGQRLGRGGGYYDVFLKKYRELATQRRWKQPLLVALSYSPQIVEEGAVPVTPNDVTVDALVSPAGVIPISPAALEIM